MKKLLIVLSFIIGCSLPLEEPCVQNDLAITDMSSTDLYTKPTVESLRFTSFDYDKSANISKDTKSFSANGYELLKMCSIGNRTHLVLTIYGTAPIITWHHAKLIVSHNYVNISYFGGEYGYINTREEISVGNTGQVITVYPWNKGVLSEVAAYFTPTSNDITFRMVLDCYGPAYNEDWLWYVTNAVVEKID